MRRYRGFIGDSARWEGFPFRDDDILICTPSKSGTTWMQNIVAMLVLGRHSFDQPMGNVSPWLDMNTRPVDEVFALLDAQAHRRFIKTHTPLDGLPWDDRVTYLTVTRHPLQVAASMTDHMANLDRDRAIAVRAEAVGLDDLADAPAPPARSEDPRTALLEWITDDTDYADAGGSSSLRGLVNHVRTFWERRHHPNVHLFHYRDLRDDLDGQMRRVASVLEVDRPEPWDDFVAAATFDRMRERADVLAPDTQMKGWWRSNTDFFRSKRDRRTELDPDDQAVFDGRLRELADPDLAAWMLGEVPAARLQA